MKRNSQFKTIRRKYTTVTKYKPKGCGYQGYHVYIVIDHQSFNITPHGVDTKKEADWFRDMLATALLRLLKHETKNQTNKESYA